MSIFTQKIKPARRIAGFKPYFFADLNKRVEALQAQGMEIIRLDVGSPDMPPPDFIIQRLVESARRPETHGYAIHGGSMAFRQAATGYYQRRFGVQLEPRQEILALIGSKEGIFNLSQALLNPGDAVLVPDPGYPVYSAGGIIAGAEIFPLPLRAENGWLPDLERIPHEVAQRAKILWLNYPNNPTGATASLDFFEKAVSFARRWGILLAHDAPYVDVCFDGYKAPSLLQVKGAKDIAIEFNSLSKTCNMAGWRVGIAAGNAEIIRLLGLYKSQVDSATFLPIEVAAAEALSSDMSWIEARNQVYQQRRDIALRGLRECGFTVCAPRAAIYVWARLPAAQENDMHFCTQLLNTCGVSITPGIVFGKYGRGYVRLSLCSPAELIFEGMTRLKGFVGVNEEGEKKSTDPQ